MKVDDESENEDDTDLAPKFSLMKVSESDESQDDDESRDFPGI
jgi:hypothetical protein